MSLLKHLSRFASVLPFLVGCASIPDPAGPYDVGTLHFDFEAPSGRKLEVRVWHPATLSDDVKAKTRRLPAFEPALAKEMATMFNMPEFAFADDDTGAYMDVPVADGAFAVLLFNHGFGSFGKQNANQFEDLAKNGFIVMSLHHPGDTLLTTYEDGTTVVADRSQGPYQAMERFNKDPQPILDLYVEKFPALRTAIHDRARHRQLMQEVSRADAFSSYDVMVKRWVEDIRGLLGALDALNADHVSLQGHLDVEHVGLFGHSLGGVAMGRVAQLDDRAAAVLLYDSPMLDFTALGAPAPQQRIPTCFTYADAVTMNGVTFETHAINDAMLASAPKGSCSVLVEGAAHYNFSDMNNEPMLRMTPMLGDVDNATMAVFMRSFTRQYFLHHMFGAERPAAGDDVVHVKWND